MHRLLGSWCNCIDLAPNSMTHQPARFEHTTTGISWENSFDKTTHTRSLCNFQCRYLPQRPDDPMIFKNSPSSTRENKWNLTRICCYISLTGLFWPLLGYVELLGHDPHKPLTLLDTWKWACWLFHPSSYPKENPSSMGKSRSSCSCTFGFKFGSAFNWVFWKVWKMRSFETGWMIRYCIL